MSDSEIGLAVWLKPSARRYHPGFARIVGRDGRYYVVYRIGDFHGAGRRQFRVDRGEFEIIEIGQAAGGGAPNEVMR